MATVTCQTQAFIVVGVPESDVKRVASGQVAIVTLPEKTLEGVVSDVASITKPAGWWTGNQVRYDTIVSLPPVEGLRPGTSAEVEIQVAVHQDVLLIPVAAIIEINERHFCWVQTSAGEKRQRIQNGDSNDVFTIVETGLQEGDEVLLNPSAFEAPVVEEGSREMVNETEQTATF